MTSYRPEGWPAVAPRLFADDVAGLVGFLKAVFGARGEVHGGAPAEMWIGESVIMVSDGGGLREASRGFLYVYVPDADETWARAIAAGGHSIEDPADTPYGDRRATVRDPWGNSWQIATRQETL